MLNERLIRIEAEIAVTDDDIVKLKSKSPDKSSPKDD